MLLFKIKYVPNENLRVVIKGGMMSRRREEEEDTVRIHGGYSEGTVGYSQGTVGYSEGRIRIQ